MPRSDEHRGGRFVAMETMAMLSAPDASIDDANASVGVLEAGTVFDVDGSQSVAVGDGGLERTVLRVNLEQNGLPDPKSSTYGWVSEVSASGLSVVCVDLSHCHRSPAQRLVGKSNVYFDGYYKCERKTSLYEELTKYQQRSVGPEGEKHLTRFFDLHGKTAQALPPGAIVKAIQHAPRAPGNAAGALYPERYRSYVRTPAGWIVVAKSRSTFSWATHADWSATPISCHELVLRAGGGTKDSADNWLAQFRQTPLGARIEFVWHAALWLQAIGLASSGFWHTHGAGTSCTIWANEEQLDDDGNPCDPSTSRLLLMLFGVEAGITVLWHMVHQKCCNPCVCFNEYYMDGFSKSGRQARGVVGELDHQPAPDSIRAEHFFDALLPCKWPWEMLSAKSTS